MEAYKISEERRNNILIEKDQIMIKNKEFVNKIKELKEQKIDINLKIETNEL